MSFPLIKYVLMAAIRDRLILSMLVIFFLGSSLALFLGDAAVIEKDQFTVIFAASGLRLISVFGLVLFVVFFVRRSFDGKDIEFLLSRPVGRLKIIFSYAFSFSLLALLMGISVGLCVYALAPHLFAQGHLLWVVSIIVENIIMVNVALFFAMYISSSASAAMVTSGSYILARMMGQLLGITDSSLVDSAGIYSMALQFVSVIIPRLDLMGQSSWLIYGVEGSDIGLLYIIGQGLVFTSLVLAAASLDFVRRQF
ncbi:MAG: hypothetical protein ACRBB3_02240 [Alphaproteobacteria bacterium]